MQQNAIKYLYYLRVNYKVLLIKLDHTFRFSCLLLHLICFKIVVQLLQHCCKFVARLLDSYYKVVKVLQ